MVTWQALRRIHLNTELNHWKSSKDRAWSHQQFYMILLIQLWAPATSPRVPSPTSLREEQTPSLLSMVQLSPINRHAPHTHLLPWSNHIIGLATITLRPVWRHLRTSHAHHSPTPKPPHLSPSCTTTVLRPRYSLPLTISNFVRMASATPSGPCLTGLDAAESQPFCGNRPIRLPILPHSACMRDHWGE